MSWITIEWSAVVTAAPTGSALRWRHRVTGRSLSLGDPELNGTEPTKPDVALKHSFRLYFWSVVVVQFKRNTFRAAQKGVGQTGLQHEGLINHDSDWQLVHCFNIGKLQFSHFILSQSQTHSFSGQWQSVMYWWRSGSWWSRVTGCWREFCLQREILVFLKLELSLKRNEKGWMKLNEQMTHSSRESWWILQIKVIKSHSQTHFLCSQTNCSWKCTDATQKIRID